LGIYRFRTWILFKGLSEKRIAALLPDEPRNLAKKLKKAEDPDRFLCPYVEAVKEHFPAINGWFTAYTSNRGSQVFRANVDYKEPGLMTVVYSRLARKSGVPFKLESFVTSRRFDEKTAQDFDLPDSVLVKE
jgi:hypothetical protein